MNNVLAITYIVLFSTSLWSLEGFDIFDERSDEGGAKVLPYSISGELGMKLESYLDLENTLESETNAYPFMDLDFEITNETIESKVAFTFSTEYLESPLKIEDLIKELYLKKYFNFGYIEAGYLKTEWGKGDGDHVIDILNPLDLSKGIRLDLNEMKSPEILLRQGLYLGDIGLLEIVYKPFFSPIKYAKTGRWSIANTVQLPGLNNTRIPDTRQLRYTQAAIRGTLTIGAVDMGFMYYFGYMTEPGYKFTSNMSNIIEITYTRAHLVGIEAAWALGPLTMRSELGFWLSEDFNGDKKELYNNRFVYLGGLDYTIPKINLFLSLQFKGAFVFHYDYLAQTDVDKLASFSDSANSNSLLSSLELPFFNDKMKLRLSNLLQIETTGYMLGLSYFWTILDDLELSVHSKIFGGRDRSLYRIWDDNDSISINIKFIF